MRFILIVACDKNGGIAKDNKLPWGYIYKDINFFHDVTIHTDDKMNVVIMGSKTYFVITQSMGHPLLFRHNIVLTRNKNLLKNKKLGIFYDSFESALDWIDENENDIGNVFIIGGAEIYNQAIERGIVDIILLTRITLPYEIDNMTICNYLSTDRINEIAIELYSSCVYDDTISGSKGKYPINYRFLFLLMENKQHSDGLINDCFSNSIIPEDIFNKYFMNS